MAEGPVAVVARAEPIALLRQGQPGLRGPGAGSRPAL